MCLKSVWSWSLEKWEGLGPQGAVEPLEKKISSLSRPTHTPNCTKFGRAANPFDILSWHINFILTSFRFVISKFLTSSLACFLLAYRSLCLSSTTTSYWPHQSQIRWKTYYQIQPNGILRLINLHRCHSIKIISYIFTKDAMWKFYTLESYTFNVEKLLILGRLSSSFLENNRSKLSVRNGLRSLHFT